ncbi:hypothetical protein F3F96_10385 [Mariprofundus sp. NF]|uniref:MBOAT family O-acyltransferase n=1 Tax=Mariprofundus sp. NF TaxID=2608716 RepID=UPI0015A07642|nr:MBOAT family O-acyltransferase [Mariprofundus sp. NF]NWF39540.1 hypothetical protein [Mariprofundus sp. NF]
MTDFQAVYFVWMVATVIVTWISPRQWQVDVVAISTVIFVAIYSPWSCFWLISASLLTYLCICISPTKKPALIGVSIILIAVVFLVYKWLSPGADNTGAILPVMLGLSYYTCRHIHILMEVYKGNIQTMSLRRYFHYQLFLPVLVVGPIHRYQNFQRQCERRRWDSVNLTTGFERILYGYAKVVVLGNWLLNHKLGGILEQYAGDGFWGIFIISAKDWLYLYIEFSGYIDVALGFSLLLGFHIEENFNHPLKARNLIDFWQRWHITLSSWCKDYVFSPVQAKTRNQLLAVFAAMTVMGLWHELSLYYFLWGFYHATGIALCRLYQLNDDPLRLSMLPAVLQNAITRTATFTWLVAGMPVITSILSFAGLG